MSEVETFALPAAELGAFRLAAMTLDRDRALLAAAEATLRGVRLQIAASERALSEAQGKLVATITEGGYEIAEETVDVEAGVVKRRKVT